MNRIRIALLLVFTLSTLSTLSPQNGLASEGGGSVYLPGYYGDFTMGAVPLPGYYFKDFAYYYNAGAGRTLLNGRDRIDLTENVVSNVFELRAVSPWTLLGGKVWASAIIPFTFVSLESALAFGNSFSVQGKASQAGFSDPYVIPFGLAWEIGNVHLRFFEGINIPVGQYDSNDVFSVGRHYWAFDTNLAASWSYAPVGLELGANLGFLLNTTNTATEYRTGNEFHLDYTLGIHLSERTAFAAVGYFYRQVSGDSGSGAVLGPFEGRSNGVGPALNYILDPEGQSTSLVLKWIHEFDVVNRFGGNYLDASVAMSF